MTNTQAGIDPWGRGFAYERISLHAAAGAVELMAMKDTTPSVIPIGKHPRKRVLGDMDTNTTTAREQVLCDYSVDQNGVIRSPGKFELQPIFTPYFWNLALEGFSDMDNGVTFTFDIRRDNEARKLFPELNSWLGRARILSLTEDSMGFVHCSHR